MNLVAREIVEEHLVTSALESASKKYPRTNDWWMGWTWRLARDPEIDAYPIQGSTPQTYMLKTGAHFVQYGAPPASTIVYTFNDKQVNILAINIP